MKKLIYSFHTKGPSLFIFFTLVLLLIWFSMYLSPTPLAAPTSTRNLSEIIREVERKYLGDSAEGEMTMQIVTRHYTRKMSMEYWSKGKDRFLIKITSPAKDSGISTLKVNKEIWNYLPKVDRVIKIPTSMMGGSWMGSHITNDDLVKETQVAEDYTFKPLEDTKSILVVEGIPKPEATVVWGKIIYKILMPDLVPLEVSFFDEEDNKVRIIKYSEVKEIDGRKIPLKLEVLPLEKTDESTIIFYRNIRFGVFFKDNFFSLKSLKNR